MVLVPTNVTRALEKVSAPPRCSGQKSAERTLYCLGSTHSIHCQGLSWQRVVHDQRHLKERVLDCSQRPRFKNCDNSVCCCSSLQTPRVSSAKQQRASTLPANTHTRARAAFSSRLYCPSSGDGCCHSTNSMTVESDLANATYKNR
jgi:hypothetical protein